jgi:hypothetical protein
MTLLLHVPTRGDVESAIGGRLAALRLYRFASTYCAAASPSPRSQPAGSLFVGVAAGVRAGDDAAGRLTVASQAVLPCQATWPAHCTKGRSELGARCRSAVRPSTGKRTRRKFCAMRSWKRNARSSPSSCSSAAERSSRRFRFRITAACAFRRWSASTERRTVSTKSSRRANVRCRRCEVCAARRQVTRVSAAPRSSHTCRTSAAPRRRAVRSTPWPNTNAAREAA